MDFINKLQDLEVPCLNKLVSALFTSIPIISPPEIAKNRLENDPKLMDMSELSVEQLVSLLEVPNYSNTLQKKVINVNSNYLVLCCVVFVEVKSLLWGNLRMGVKVVESDLGNTSHVTSTHSSSNAVLVVSCLQVELVVQSYKSAILAP